MMYPWGDERRYNSYSGYFRRIFGSRVQKLSVNVGFTCPNRDGTVGFGGCTFCRNDAFTPSYCSSTKSVQQQLQEGIEFHRNRYRSAERYIAYFQSFSNTYASLDVLKQLYASVFDNPEVIGVIVGTRPDCMDEEKLDFFAELSRHHYVSIEYGIESCYDTTLKAINRRHDYACAAHAVKMTAERGLHVGAHFILGLPGEMRTMLFDQIERINALPLTTLKFHQLQIFRDTPMAELYAKSPDQFHFWTCEEYIDFVIDLVERLRPDVVLERFASEAPPRFQAGPTWGMIRNEQLWNRFERRLLERDTYQGKFFDQI